jgi:signal transduction histidine kinase
VDITVRDFGAGIPPETLKRVFKPFFTSKNKGTGLGLSIAQKIIEAHGGRLTMESVPGDGTTVRIRLPARSALDREIPPGGGENPPTVSM